MAKSTLTPEERAAKKREYMREYLRAYQAKNAIKVSEYQAEYRAKNAAKIHAYKLQNYADNKDEILAANKRYYELNKEKVLAINREWTKNNPEKNREINKRWIGNHKEQHNAAGRKWLQDNPDKRAAAYKRWCKKFPEKVRHHTSKRRIAQAEQMPRWVAKEELQEVFKACPPAMHVDHIVPLRGITLDGHRVSGLHVPWNLQYLTLSQNSRKRNRMRLEDHATCGAPIE